MRPLLAPLTLTAAILAPGSAASASTISLDGTTLLYQAAPKASNLVTRDHGFAELLQPVTVGDGCLAGTPIICSDIQSAQFDFGNKDDTFRGYSNYPYTINGNAGADSIRAAGGKNFVNGGAGRDSIWENGNSRGSVEGGTGDDKIYSREAASQLHGDEGDDLVVADSADRGSRIFGDEGNDQLVAKFGDGVASGGDGADTIAIDGFSSWTIDGGAGRDTIKAGPRHDVVTGGDGNDVVDTSGDPGSPETGEEGSADNVDCGNGKNDIAYADADDVIVNCERVYLSTPVLAAVDHARADAAAHIAAMPSIPLP